MINWIKSKSISLLTIVFIALVSGILVFSVLLKEKGNYKVIASDGIGYYSYLPNTFNNYSLDNQTPDNRFFNEVKDKGVNKYFSGTAVSMFPFYVLGNGLALIRGEETDGFTLSYQVVISFAGWCYLLGGLLFFRGILKLFDFSEGIISITTLVLFFGTNLLVYSLWQPSMSHVYSFFWISGFLYFIKKYSINNNKSILYWAALFLGIVILIRPLNGIIIFIIPFLLESQANFNSVLKSVFFKKRLMVSILIVITILFIQSVFWYLQCGKFLVWSYANEGFEFANPHWQEFLFSFRKGALVYTPILLLSTAGAITLIRKNRFQAVSGILFSLGLIYLLSSWWNWYYGPSFGQRPLVEFYAFSGILIAYLLSFLKSKLIKISIGILVISLIFMNLIQTYQFQKGIISSWDMNWEKYQYSFLKTGSDFENNLGGNNDIMLFNTKIDSVYSKEFDFEYREKPNSGRKYERLDKIEIGYRDYSDREFNFDHQVIVSEDFISSRGVFIQVEIDILDKEITNTNEALFVVDITDTNGQNYHYYTFPIRSIPSQEIEVWKREYYNIEIPELRSSGDRIKVYVWNKGKESFWIDNVKLNFLALN